MSASVCPPITAHIDRASFNLWSKNDIKKISVKHITEPKSFEKAGAMAEDGLYSPVLGAIKNFEICPTCGQNNFNCPGHYGHIELSVPVYHPMLIQIMYQLINKCCLECFHLRLSKPNLRLFLAQMEALNCGFDHLIEELDDIAADMLKASKTDDESYLQVILGKRLEARIREEKDKTPDFDCQKRPQQRSIVERLSKLFRNFVNGKIIKPAKVCPNCYEKKTTISLHQQAVIVVGVGSSKPIDTVLNSSLVSETTIEEVANSKKKKRKSSKKDRRGHELEGHLHYLKTDEKRFLTPIGARYLLRKLWRNEKYTMQRIFHFLNVDIQNTLNEKPETSESLDESRDEDPKTKLKSDDKFQPIDLFFVDTILVPPSKFRPPMSQRGYSFEGPGTAALSNVMKQSVVVQDIIDLMVSESDEVEAERMQVKVQASWKLLQQSVNCLWDNEMDKYGKSKYPGLKQLIDKKEGLFRKNMMGKRVNFAARSVISPDPNILVDQIGVPLVFAKKLTYPQPVTPWNIEQLKKAILNGPDVYPGAVSIVYDDGFTVSLTKESVREQIAARLSHFPRNRQNRFKQSTPMATIVNRHLLTGDVLLFNRQPTLHKPSIMAFRARVLPNEKGFRLHYANCKSFNADFDGDEMNAHLPQSELARSEAYNIASVNHQYLVPKDGSPLGGLIQDHVVAVCILTRRDQFYDKHRYNQLVYCAVSFLDKPIKLEKPTIIKPRPLWTGKQVITTIIKNCIPDGKRPPTLNIKSKIGPKILNIPKQYEDLSDCFVHIRDGELIHGFMDKSNVGATQYGLIHTCYELYGGETSSNLMSAFARLSTWYLMLYEGFTLGIHDILVEDDANADRQDFIKESKTVGDESAKEALGVEGPIDDQALEDKLREAHSDRDPLPMKKLDAAMKSRTDKYASKISSRCLPDGLICKFPANNLQMMIQSGAKGGTVNALQISCLLGQIELEGRRVPLSMSGRSLPSFKPYDTCPKAGGFVSGRFLTGIQPQEFFFHCMAGREGLIDTAVKTSRSGYLQRCLIKHLEGLTVQYDQTVRDSCGSVIQFLYGEDGLDICKSQMLKDGAFKSLIENYQIISPSNEEQARLNKAKEIYEEDVITRTNEIQSWLELNGEDRIKNLRGSGFLDFLSSQLEDVKANLDDGSSGTLKLLEEEEANPGDISSESLSTKVKEEVNTDDYDRNASVKMEVEVMSQEKKQRTYIGSSVHDQIFEAWYALSFKEKKKWNRPWDPCPDPLTALMNPAAHFGVVPERLDRRIENFVKSNPRLIADSAALIGECENSMVCDENPELSKSILAHVNQSLKLLKPKLTKHEFYNLCYNLYMKMLAQPGEAVGLLAAQSIGEPSTQMTLNTFHFAGRGEMNVTLGIPRLREILMTASVKIATPSMDLPLLKVIKDEFGNELDEQQMEEQAKRVKLALNAVRLSDVLEYVDITEQEVAAPSGGQFVGSQSRTTRSRKRPRESSHSASQENESMKSVRYDITFALLPSKYYKHEFKTKTSKVKKFIEEVFSGQLLDAMHKRQKRLQNAESMFDLTTRTINRNQKTSDAKAANDDPEEEDLDNYNAKAKAKEKVGEEESSSDDDDEPEGDNTTQRIKNRRNQDLDYEEPEDDDLEVGDADAKVVEEEEGNPEILIADEDEQDSLHATLAASGQPTTTGDSVNDRAAGDEGNEMSDPDKRWCKLAKTDERTVKLTLCVPLTLTRLDMGALIETEAKRTYVHRVGNIQRALLVKDVNAKSRGAKCDKMIKTEGVSLLSLVNFNDILDLNAIYSNDIHAIANTYGIEAASQAIRREMANVFAVYGIEVDPRHLSLIADYMTYNGTIRGMNRMSMEASASPFQQMSYESTARYLKWAAILGLYDDIKSPSAALVFGRPTKSGTGIFTTLTDSGPAFKNKAR